MSRKVQQWVALTPILVLLLLGCSGQGCKEFSTQTQQFCIPEQAVLRGSYIGLPKPTDYEIGFFLGEKRSDRSSLIVTLSDKALVCGGANKADQLVRLCLEQRFPDFRSNGDELRIEKTGGNQHWTYVLETSSGKLPISGCNAIPDGDGGRCMFAGSHGDAIFSVIFYDAYSQSVQEIDNSVRESLEKWVIGRK